MVRFGRGAGNVLVKALNAALPDSAQITGGWQIIGQTAGSLPVSGAIGAASNAARAMPVVGKR